MKVDKVFSSAREAVADLADGSTIALPGFGLERGFPSTLVLAVAEKGAKELCLVCNGLGAAGGVRGMLLVENHQVKKLIASFSARPGLRSPAEDQIAAGELSVELVPQGTLVERCRAAGAGLAGFYTPTAVGTPIAEGKDLRYFNGKPYLLEEALPVDYAFVTAFRADRNGNLEFRGASQNFNPSFAKAARVAIAEVEHIVEVGEIPPERVGLPGIFVSRVVQRTIAPNLGAAAARPPRSAESARQYNGKPGLTRAGIAQRAAQLLPTSSYVNLGLGIPGLVSNYLGGRNIRLHAENGVLGYGELVHGDAVDPDIFNASAQAVALESGASFFDSVTSFEMARGGKLDAVILGAYQVDQEGNLANWSTPEMEGGGIGGAMDLVAGSSTLIILMEHQGSRGESKLIPRCTYPLTGVHCVDIVVTDLALLRRRDGRFILEEVAPGFSPAEVLALTGMGVTLADNVGIMGV